MPLLRRLLTPLLWLMALAAVSYGGVRYWRTEFRPFEATDNAYLRIHMAQISPRVMGYLAQVNFEDNQKIAAGALLAVIDDTDFRARAAQAEAEVAAHAARQTTLIAEKAVQEARIAQTRAAIYAAGADRERAQKDLVRLADLVEDGAVSAQTRDAADATHKQARANVQRTDAALQEATSQLAALDAQIAEAGAALKVAQAALAVSKIDLAHTRIYAPLAGTLGNRNAQLGQLVQPGALLAFLIPDQGLYIEANFKETQLEDLRPGQPVKIKIDAYPHTVYRGVVTSSAPASGAEFSILPPENATGNFTKIVRRVPIKIEFETGTDLTGLRPGLSTTISVRVR